MKKIFLLKIIKKLYFFNCSLIFLNYNDKKKKKIYLLLSSMKGTVL